MRVWWIVLNALLIPLCSGAAANVRAADARANDEPPVAAPPLVDEAELAALVEQLGHEDYKQREAASRAIADYGLDAKPALVAALSHDDPEVRLRARRCLGLILDADRAARLRAFQADKQGTKGHDLPGWQRYRRQVGNGQAEREFFVQMQRAEPALLESAAAGGQVTNDALLMRCRQLSQNRNIVSRSGGLDEAAVSALLLVASDPEAPLTDEVLVQVQNLVYQGNYRQVLQRSVAKDPARKVLGLWVTREGPTLVQYRNLQLAARCGLHREAVITGLRLALDPKTQASYRVYSILAVGKGGGRRHVEPLEKLLDDETVGISQRRIVNGKLVIDPKVQIRDVALAVVIHLAGQDPKAYGFTQLRKSTTTLFTSTSLGFPSDEHRQKALQRWKKWRAEHPDLTKNHPTKTPPEKPPAATRARAATPLIRVAQLAGRAAAAQKRQRDEPWLDAHPFYRGEREIKVHLARARGFVAQGRYTDAIALLDNVLAEHGGASFQPDRARPIYVSLRAEADRLIGRFPPAARRMYELHVGVAARQALNDAVADGDAEALRVVSERYFHAEAGQEATLLWAEHLLDTGQPLAAALVLQRLRRQADDDRLEPALSALLARSWSRAGMAAKALEALEAWPQRPGESIEIAGRRFPPGASAEEMARALAPGADLEPAAADGDAWPLPAGNPQGNADTSGAVPWLRPKWRVPTARRPPAETAIAELQRAYRQEHLAALPAGCPLAVEGRVLARTTGALVALSVDSGQLAWRVPFNDAVDQLLAGTPNAPSDAPFLSQGLDERLWGDATYGRMTSDGRFVYGVEDVGFAYGLSNQRLVVMPDGSRRLDAGWPRDYNRLTAYDVRTGKLQWEIGGPRGDFALEAAGAFFLGPPLPVAGRLYAVAEIDGAIELLSLAVENGAVRGRIPLGGIDPGVVTPPNVFFGSSALPRRPARRLAGASPAYSEGILVCPISYDGYVAVELARGDLLWSYQTDSADATLNPFNPFARRQRTVEMLADERDARWADTQVRIVEGRVLITPRAGDRLYCLSLSSGLPLWEAPREDSQYVGGVQEGVVLLVGRGGIRGLRLSDGQAAWNPTGLPPGAAPSGRGFRSGGRYYLPLTSAEVAVYDIATGKLLRRSRSPDRGVPGNLVCHRGQVVSQSVDGIEAYGHLADELERVAAAARLQPDDPAMAARFGELLLFAGRYREAIAQLRRAGRLQPGGAAREMLAAALLEALRTDFAAYRQTAAELQDVFQTPAQQAAYQRAQLEGLMDRDEPEACYEAFRAALKMMQLDDDSLQLEPVDTALQVRRDHWLKGRVQQLRQLARGAQRGQIDRDIARRLDEALAARGPEALRRFLHYFGDHPSAPRARAQLARRLAGSRHLLERELLLLELAGSADAARAAAATADLAEMLASTSRAEAAARLYRRLGGELADVPCRDGKTGRQLLAELAPKSPARTLLTDADPWRRGEVELTSLTSVRASYTGQYPVYRETSRHPLEGELSIQVLQTGATHTLQARGLRGDVRWSVELKFPGGDRSPRSFSAAQLRARSDGHLMLVWRGNELYALDTLTDGGSRARVLWAKDLSSKFPGAESNVTVLPRVFGGAAAIGRVVAPGGIAQGVADLGPLNGHVVCYQRMRDLVAVDPLTGEPLWQRHDVRLGSQLLGDEEVILAVPPNAQQADVYATADGRRLGQCPVPDADTQVLLLGRRILTWSIEGTEDEEKPTLALVDPWGQSDVWRREFTAGSQIWLVGPDEAAVMQPDGQFVVLSLPEGRVELQSRLHAEPQLRGLYVLRTADRYVVIASRPLASGNIVYAVAGSHCPLVCGKVYGFDRHNGRRLWEAEVDDQSLDLDQPADLPVLVFACREYNQNQQGVRRHVGKVLCLDKRTGRVLYKEEITNSFSRVEAVPNLDKQTIDIRTTRKSVRLKFEDAEPQGPIKAPDPGKVPT